MRVMGNEMKSRHDIATVKAGTSGYAVEGICVHTARVAYQAPLVCRGNVYKVLVHSGRVQLIAATAW